MKNISQRQLRNDNADIVRGVEAGETYTITRHGVPVAKIGPITDEGDLRCVRPAKTRPTFAALPRVSHEVSSEEILDDLRGDR